MAKATVLRQQTNLPAPIAELETTYGLTLSQVTQLHTCVETYSTNVATIRVMLDSGLEVPEIEQMLDARARVNVQLGDADKSQQERTPQTVSIRGLIRFQQTFRNLPIEAESMTEMLLELHDRWQGQYLDMLLKALVVMSKHFPDSNPEALVDLITGESDFPGIWDSDAKAEEQ